MKAVIFDLDGTITTPAEGRFPGIDNFNIRPGTAHSMKKFADFGFVILVASNQGGVSAGFKTVSEVQKYFRQVQNQLNTEYKVAIQEFIACYSDSKDNAMRKPNAGMYHILSQKYCLRTATTLYVGDATFLKNKSGHHSTSDKEFAKNAQIHYCDAELFNDSAFSDIYNSVFDSNPETRLELLYYTDIQKALGYGQEKGN